MCFLQYSLESKLGQFVKSLNFPLLLNEDQFYCFILSYIMILPQESSTRQLYPIELKNFIYRKVIWLLLLQCTRFFLLYKKKIEVRCLNVVEKLTFYILKIFLYIFFFFLHFIIRKMLITICFHLCGLEILLTSRFQFYF